MGNQNDQMDALVCGLRRVPLIIDEYHDNPRPGYVVPAWSRDQGGYFIQVPPIHCNNDEQPLEHRWSKEEICSVLGVPAEMFNTLKSNEREHEEMYQAWLKSRFGIQKGGST
ncbi:hypothetical protein NYE24_00605 [Paenibacillus sp. FSL H7-0350]|uniref:hypothetical protein n=1 Tax=Paenibacillus sp. FSL H7-0350 TaxID=2975345 RepID=UPI0031590E7C